ncbi:hypothetical protein SCLCIDRAFT_1179879 [Scleroderma citrinum Foug A]|uniref:Uncharacterized protein n=1 Tax=Scleroderma citrinum Foug A TaxID=1036808 RepID=A0A0C2ZIS9_9AGAM|nr:hypothetical protein SCLCIDRAFT_1179879 [Scleroderma citrinum Foug A]
MSPPLLGSGSSPPPTYMIGPRKPSKPLVTVEQVQEHLQLLDAFHRLRVTVEQGKDNRIPGFAVRMDKDSRWRWFIHLAIDRFEKWVEALQFARPGQFLAKYHPPLDVCMVWHAYMLCPSWYAEDCERLDVLQYLRPLNMFMLGSMDTETYAERHASGTRASSWYQQTGTHFDPFDAMSRRAYKQVECPGCQTRLYVPFVNDNNTGYAENFSATCPRHRCRMKITKDSLAVAKFVRDLNQKPTRQDQDYYIAGSLINSSGKHDPRRARVIREKLIQSLQHSDRLPLTLDGRLAKARGIGEIKESVGYSLESLRDAVTAALRNYPAATASRILSAYTDGSPFSVDLLDAVLRQAIFTEKMHEIGWTDAATFQKGKVQVLDHAILRYHAFLDLISSRPNYMSVPTLDIDLVWHTHQLMAGQYGSDCELYVGRYVDHELKVRENRLSAAFDETCLAWQLRYQVPYMQCGCTLPNESSWRKCMRLVRQHLRSKPYLPTALHRDHIPATHPSIHNAILSSHRKVIELPGWMMSDGGRNLAHAGNGVQVQSYTVRAQGHDAQRQGYGTPAHGDGAKPQGYNVQAPGPQLSRKLSGRGTQPQGHNVQHRDHSSQGS